MFIYPRMPTTDIRGNMSDSQQKKLDDHTALVKSLLKVKQSFGQWIIALPYCTLTVLCV